MAKKSIPAKTVSKPAKIEPKEAPKAAIKGKTTTTPVRNTAIPKAGAMPAVPVGRPEVSQDAIARRAFEISRSPANGSQDDNWHRAERELRGL